MPFASLKIEKLEDVVDALDERIQRSRHVDSGDVVVGYQAPFAIYVHENLEAKHENGQAKFLEQPARTMQAELFSTIVDDVRHGKGLQEAKVEAAHKLLKVSQQLVPVAPGPDGGRLRDSGFVEVVE